MHFAVCYITSLHGPGFLEAKYGKGFSSFSYIQLRLSIQVCSSWLLKFYLHYSDCQWRLLLGKTRNIQDTRVLILLAVQVQYYACQCMGVFKFRLCSVPLLLFKLYQDGTASGPGMPEARVCWLSLWLWTAQIEWLCYYASEFSSWLQHIFCVL